MVVMVAGQEVGVVDTPSYPKKGYEEVKRWWWLQEEVGVGH